MAILPYNFAGLCYYTWKHARRARREVGEKNLVEMYRHVQNYSKEILDFFNVNVKIEQEVRIKLEKDVEELLDKESDLF